jgi:hypothetical protein
VHHSGPQVGHARPAGGVRLKGPIFLCVFAKWFFGELLQKFNIKIFSNFMRLDSLKVKNPSKFKKIDKIFKIIKLKKIK